MMTIARKLGRIAAALPTLAVLGSVSAAADRAELRPIMAVPSEVVLQEDFETAKPLAKGVFTRRQGTRWNIEDGVLRGRPSTPAFRATKKDHFGYEPRLSIPACPQEYVIEFDVRFVGGQPTAIVPFVEFGHHVARLAFRGEEGAKLIADHESTRIADAPDFKLEPDHWYHMLAEIKGDEIVIQVADGPTLYGRHEIIAGTKDGFGVAGNKEGIVELDNLTVWKLEAAAQPTWESTREALPRPTNVSLKHAAAKR